MNRYKVPRIAFINKCDRTGANPERVTEQLREKLQLNAVMMQIPIGLEADHQGVVDLVRMTDVVGVLHLGGPAALSRAELAEELCVSVNTVKTHLTAISRKLGATGATSNPIIIADLILRGRSALPISAFAIDRFAHSAELKQQVTI